MLTYNRNAQLLSDILKQLQQTWKIVSEWKYACKPVLAALQPETKKRFSPSQVPYVFFTEIA